MAVPIIYVQTYPGSASADGDGAALAIFADDNTAQHQTVLATVGGLLTLTLTSRGSGLTSGTYPNVSILFPSGAGSGATAQVGVSATGQATVVAPFAPGYGWKIGDTFQLNNAQIGTAGSTITTMTVLTVLPCSAPFPVGTKFVEINCDVNGPAFITFDSTLSSLGVSNGILTTEQSTLTTAACRITSSERLVRRVNTIYAPVLGAQGAGFAQPVSLQVIMGTAAA